MFNRGQKPILPARTRLATEKVVDDGYQGRAALPAKSLVDQEKGRVAELVLEDQVEPAGQQPLTEIGGKVLTKLTQVRTAGKADHFHLVAQPFQALDHDSVIEIAAGEGLQAAVNNQADAHQRGAR